VKTAVICALLIGGAACESSARTPRLFENASTDALGAPPTNVRRIAVDAPRSLTENSTAVITAAQSDIVFTINDSGNDPELFALDTSGVSRGVWRVSDAKNVDWEAMSWGPCKVARPLPARQCLYIADTGDNSALRGLVALYRIAEPEAKRAGNDNALPSEKLSFRYPDAPYDVEAAYTTQSGDTYVITKRKLRSSDGSLRNALVFLVPAAAWNQHETIVAQLVDSLPIVVGSSRLREITDASLSHDARRLAVRTYDQIYVFAVDSSSGRVNHSVPPAVCNIRNVERKHGEGIAWIGTNHELLLDSEGRNNPMFRVTCPMPQL
jgi:hypothetical protein